MTVFHAGHAAVVNVSAPAYNLGAAKLADWLVTQGYHVTPLAGDPGLFAYGFDLVCLSVIFSWHAPRARDIALRVRAQSDVWCGGPGMFALAAWWKRETGLPLQRGLDTRFDHQRGSYRMTFASRGCPVDCSFCLVPRLEGTTFTLDWDFQPAPVLLDNNLSALPVDFQEHIIQRYRETGTTLRDANSGFEPRTFDEACYWRWKPVLRGPWRFAFDEWREADDVQRMMHILRGENQKRKRVYVLVGNEPIQACYERAMQVVAWGGEPFCQYLKPLNWLGDPAAIRHRHDWTWRRGQDFCRYFNRFLWKYVRLQDYRSRKQEPSSFADLVA
jgi:pyruvate-formate lyase-activating enzyme